MIATYSKKIVGWLVSRSRSSQDEEQIEVYVYGMECFMNTAITVFILMIWAIFTRSFFETLCWITFFSALRHHAGGLHAPTQFTCILSSSILGVSNYFVVQYQEMQVLDKLFIFIGCFAVCILYAPTDSGKLKLSLSESRKQKCVSIVILILGTLISISRQNNVSDTIMYSFFCVCLLILIKKVSDRMS